MRIHLGGSSRQSLAAARTNLDALVKGASSADASQLSSDLFGAVEIVSSNTALRRAITDPSRDGASKAALIKDLFGSKVSAKAVTLLGDVAGLRWSSAGDLVVVLEQLAVEAEASAANIANELDRVEDEFFGFSQGIADSFELRTALIGAGSIEAKKALVQDLLGKNASTSTLKLVTELVSHLRGRSIEGAFADFMWALAARRDRVIAHVRVASEITPAQRERLSAALTATAGQPVRVNVEVDPTVLGGISVTYGDELVDGTVVSRLSSAGRALAGLK